MNQSTPPQALDFLLPRKQVEKIAGISRASIYRLIKAGKFPAPYSLNTGAVRWKQSDIHRMASKSDKDSVRVHHGTHPTIAS